jgi:heme/copper-type cytochrome/quinol oxidase subunit 2
MVAVPNDDLVIALFGAFATFTAFGAAIAGFVAAGGVVQSLASWWAQHGEAEAFEKPRPDTRVRRLLKSARKRTSGTIWPVAGIIIAVILISGAGLVFSSIWLYAYTDGSVSGVSWAYSWAISLFWTEVPLLSLATAATVIAAALSAVTASRSANSSSDMDDAVRDAAIRNLAPGKEL